VEYNDQIAQFPLVITEGDGPTLLGRYWCDSVIQIDWPKIYYNAYSEIQTILDKYLKLGCV